MSLFTQLRLKLGEVFGKYSSLFAKEGTCTRELRTPRSGDRTGLAKLCLSCQAVWIRGPHDLCTNCELSPYVLNEGSSNYPSPFAKMRTSTSGFRAPGPRDGIKPPRLCLGCRAVWVQGPPELCNNCELSPYILPVFQEEEEWPKKKNKKDWGGEGEVGGVSGWEEKYTGKAKAEDPTQYNILKRGFHKEIVKKYSWED
ncbi:hypothetical protein B9Z19DRAFT_1128281 [Tuber borchii]|uniref:Uncharacterized protein n=1 Tax=Tuber borchii TaxID=42251 RepID=A0A2T6ZPQ9_TUBBO|nr:hypothetical protein B9Z19DRAFT_1128281 [Tuber borchii]